MEFWEIAIDVIQFLLWVWLYIQQNKNEDAILVLSENLKTTNKDILANARQLKNMLEE